MSTECWLVFDTETTGLLKPSSAPLAEQPQIIEIALIRLERVKARPDDSNGDWRSVAEGSWLVNPFNALPAEITKITGLTDKDLNTQPGFAELLPALLPWFLGATGLIAHNLPFDREMLVNELRRIGCEYAFPYPPRQLCTVAHYHPEYGHRMKLRDLYERKMNKPFEQRHRALDDTRALAEIVLQENLLAGQ